MGYLGISFLVQKQATTGLSCGAMLLHVPLMRLRWLGRSSSALATFITSAIVLLLACKRYNVSPMLSIWTSYRTMVIAKTHWQCAYKYYCNIPPPRWVNLKSPGFRFCKLGRYADCSNNRRSRFFTCLGDIPNRLEQKCPLYSISVLHIVKILCAWRCWCACHTTL